MDEREVNISDIEALRRNGAWKWLTFEWTEMLGELQLTLRVEDSPKNIYRTQGRVSALDMVLTTIDKLQEVIEERNSGE